MAAVQLMISGVGYLSSAISEDIIVTVLAKKLANPNADDANMVGIS